MGTVTPGDEREALAWEVDRARTFVEKGDYDAALDRLERARAIAVSDMPWSASAPWLAVLAFALDLLAVGMIVGVAGRPDPWDVVHAAGALGFVGGLIGIPAIRRCRVERSWLGLVLSVIAVVGILPAVVAFSLPPEFHFLD